NTAIEAKDPIILKANPRKKNMFWVKVGNEIHGFGWHDGKDGDSKETRKEMRRERAKKQQNKSDRNKKKNKKSTENYSDRKSDDDDNEDNEDNEKKLWKYRTGPVTLIPGNEYLMIVLEFGHPSNGFLLENAEMPSYYTSTNNHKYFVEKAEKEREKNTRRELK